MNPPEPDPLDQLAAQWREDTAPRPALRRRVLARIAAEENARRESRWARWLAELRALSHPRALAGFVAVCVVVGVVTAELRATRTPVQDIGRVATTYLQAINPLLRMGSGTTP